jgi:hypothetical protein
MLGAGAGHLVEAPRRKANPGPGDAGTGMRSRSIGERMRGISWPPREKTKTQGDRYLKNPGRFQSLH